jgi:hypothetical protein
LFEWAHNCSSIVARYFKEYSKPMRLSYMPGYQKVELVLLQLPLVPMGRSGYDSHQRIATLPPCFPHVLAAIYSPVAITADLRQGRENDLLHCQHCRILSPDSKSTFPSNIMEHDEIMVLLITSDMLDRNKVSKNSWFSLDTCGLRACLVSYLRLPHLRLSVSQLLCYLHCTCKVPPTLICSQNPTFGFKIVIGIQ